MAKIQIKVEPYWNVNGNYRTSINVKTRLK